MSFTVEQVVERYLKLRRKKEEIENEAKKQSICLYDAIKLGIKGNGIIASTREKLSTFVNLIDKLSSVHYKSAGDLLKAIMDKIDCLGQLDEERRQNVTELMVSGEGREMQDFLDKVSLMSSHEQASSSNLVSLMTLHNAKGLEFPVVFIAGTEEDILPHKKSADTREGIEEERRLFYVGITRAMHELYITYTNQRSKYGKEAPSVPSRFLEELSEEVVKKLDRF